MDPIKNPFSPGAGAPPPELVGRERLLTDAKTLFGRVRERRPEKSFLMTGLRGVGKTVLLNEMERLATQQGYKTVFLEATETKPLAALLVPPLRKLLFELDRMANAGDKAKRALAVLKGFVGAVKLKVAEIEIGLDIDSVKGTADSGDLEADLPELLASVAEAAEERGTPVGIFIDEVQYLDETELGALIMAMHRMQQKQLPLLLVGAGLPSLPALAGQSKSYAERLFNFPNLGPLGRADAARAIRQPVLDAGANVDEDALEEIHHLTHGYPFFIQEWGYQSWNAAPDARISVDVVKKATSVAISRLDEGFFRVRFDRLTPREKDFLRAMSGLGPGPHPTGDVANAYGSRVSSLGPMRANLIKKGMIYAPTHGQLAFTVPLFDEFMIRVMPDGR